MILTVTLNPCVDHTAEIDHLIPGGTNHVLTSRQDPSGKGVNVGIALRQLGANPFCTGITRKGNAALLDAVLDSRGIPHDFFPAAGQLRTNLKLFDRSHGVMTECNEKGSPVTAEELDGFLSLFARLLPRAKLLVLSGSVPPGVPDDIYRTLALSAQSLRIPVILDASGPLLREGILAHPALIKPNIDELREAFGVTASEKQDLAASCREILQKHELSYLCLSMGEQGAMLVTQTEAWETPGSPVEVRGVQGAGDSMVAGLCLGLLHGDSPDELLRAAVAAAQGSLEKPGTLLCERSDFERFLPQIPVQPITL